MASQICSLKSVLWGAEGGCYGAAGCVSDLLRAGMGLAAFIDLNASVFRGTIVQRTFRSRELGKGGFLLNGKCH